MDATLEKVAGLQQAKRYNCAQVVFSLTTNGADEQHPEIAQAMQSFGSGLASGMVCGCVLGAVAAFGHLSPGSVEGKQKSNAQAQELIGWFNDEFGTTECRELKKPADGSAPVPCKKLMALTHLQCKQILKKDT